MNFLSKQCIIYQTSFTTSKEEFSFCFYPYLSSSLWWRNSTLSHLSNKYTLTVFSFPLPYFWESCIKVRPKERRWEDWQVGDLPSSRDKQKRKRTQVRKVNENKKFFFFSPFSLWNKMYSPQTFVMLSFLRAQSVLTLE